MSQRIPVTELTGDFRQRAKEALGDEQLRTNFRNAMDSLMTKRADAFPDEEEREGLREL
ncbi:MAG: (Fe-S)-binding protein, partial [Marinobacter sp.]|nr:(Fe-S)-binding protein [Marinobacter sp.]